jgi:hypothetical protein
VADAGGGGARRDGDAALGPSPAVTAARSRSRLPTARTDSMLSPAISEMPAES